MNMHRRRLAGAIVLALLVLSATGSAALIKGVLTDSLTRAPVDSALVQIKGTSAQTYTDTAGSFTLNTIAGIIFPTAAGSISPSWRSGGSITIFRSDGSVIAEKVHGSNPDALPSRLPDGLYFVKEMQSDHLYCRKMLQLNNHIRPVNLLMEHQSGRVVESLGKTSAAVTLVCSHKYYHALETPANDSDTNLSVRLSMWWPDSTNTGVPAGTVLTAYAGGAINSGAVIENKDITNTLAVSANNVTVRRCRIHLSDGYFGIQHTSGTNLLVEDCEICSDDPVAGLYTGITGDNHSVRRCNIHGWENGLSVGSNVVVEDSYIHHPPTNRPGAHEDGMEWGAGSNVIIRHNHIDILDETGCVNIGGQNSTGGIRNVSVLANLLNGGTYSIYLEGRADHTPGGIQGVQVIGNVWEKGSYTYGTHTMDGDVTDIIWSYNCLNDGTPVQK
jgi:hypothetical protein